VTVVTLMRHARQEVPEGERGGELFSVGDRPLGKEGIAQAEAARDLLADESFDRAVTSPLERSRHTAEIVAEPHGLDLEEEPDLVEVPFADPAQDPSYVDVLERIAGIAGALYDGEDPTLPTGASWSDVRDRARGAFEDVVAASDRPLVVAHGGVNRILLADALGLAPHRVFDLEQEHACVNVLDVRESRTVVRLVNGVAGGLPRPQS
jgi:broad specificity phosphatase PhoE